MSIKSKLALQLVVVLYLLIVTLLFKLNLINPDFITILILVFIEGTMMYILDLNEKVLRGITDELVISILSKVNKIGMNFLMISIAISSIILTAPLYTRYNELVISKVTIGIWLMLILFIFTIIRLLSFIYYDRKGLCK